MKMTLVLFKEGKMKKLILILAIVSTNSFAQLQLKDDSVTYKDELPKNSILSVQKFKELNGLSKYNGTIQGFSSFCKFPVESQKKFYDNFINKVTNLKLSKEENEIIDNSFKQSAYEVKKNGINGLKCEKFKVDFDKIIKDIE